MKEVHVFDFDGTITARDTFVEAIDYRYRHWRTLIGFLLHSPLIVLMKLRLYPNGRTKQRCSHTSSKESGRMCSRTS